MRFSNDGFTRSFDGSFIVVHVTQLFCRNTYVFVLKCTSCLLVRTVPGFVLESERKFTDCPFFFPSPVNVRKGILISMPVENRCPFLSISLRNPLFFGYLLYQREERKTTKKIPENTSGSATSHYVGSFTFLFFYVPVQFLLPDFFVQCFLS